VPASITPRDVHRFTAGDCHQLALRLHQLTGWPLVAFDGGDGEPLVHAGVMTPDGRVVDVRGLQTQDQWLGRWERAATILGDEARIVVCDEAQLRAWPTRFGSYSAVRARVVADLLICEIARAAALGAAYTNEN
jgi:hypothetical protein